MRTQSLNEGSADGYYADEGGVSWPNAPDTIPAYLAGAPVQQVTSRRMTKARETLLGFVHSVWVPFTSAVTSRFIGPRPSAAPWQSPYDVGLGEQITRGGPFPSPERPFPYPYQVGAVSGFWPMQDRYSMAWAYARNNSGPGVQTPIPVGWDITYPDLSKVSG